ncbi:tetratricopeptide repeat (TPR)-like superfamily protein [Tasmannia lanceolata]|uniref:tetratricopeptide repeat (TPR)-like superfamily protein n=1 Tax=Tasmannia lanceolata TaxID=3420 RepID=UPI0040632198
MISLNSHISLWNSTLTSHIQSKLFTRVFLLFNHLLKSNVKPNDLTFSLLIKACVYSLSNSHNSFNQEEPKKIHTHLVKSGFDRFVYLNTALLHLYSKCGCVFSSHQLFDEMPHRDLVSWNALISGYSRNGYDFYALKLFVGLLEDGSRPCRTTLVSVIPSCARLELLFQGKSVHGYGVKTALSLDSRVMNALTTMYAKFSDLDTASFLFESMVEKSVISWNTMIAAYGQNGFLNLALDVFHQMRLENVVPNSVTIISLLSANAHSDSTHCYSVKTGLLDSDSVITSLVCSYAKSGNTKAARLLYGLMPRKNVVSMTAIIASYIEEGRVNLALECFSQMQFMDMKPDAVTMVSILQGLTNPTYIQVGISLHCYGIKIGLGSDVLVVNGLISMYTKFDDIESSFSLFRGMHYRQLISWNLMISCCVQTGRLSDAVELFHQVKMYGHRPDSITVVNLLAGCAQLQSLQFGKRLHNYICRNNLEIEAFLVTALIDMYAKCGSIESAERVFGSVEEPCIATWNSMILGYALYGLEKKALDLYTKMRERGERPDEITFVGVLSACSHGGLVKEGRQYFKLMTEVFDLSPGVEHYACVVDLLGRAGLLDEAVMFIKNMEVEPDSVVWGALISACCTHRDIKLGECLAKRVFLLDHQNCGLYVLMSNLYAVTGRWDDVARMRKMMKDIEGDGYAGRSLIEVNSSHFLQEMNTNLCLRI